MSNVISLRFSDNHSPSEVLDVMDPGDVLLARNTNYANDFKGLAENAGLDVEMRWQRNPEGWRIRIM